jgi:hypothetical protein
MFFNETMEYRSVLDVEPTESGLTPDSAGVHRLIAESTEEWYNLREKMMKVEHVSIIREDAALLNEGANEFFKKIADFFKKMLAKIREIWKKFTVAISKQCLNDKKFVDKYEKVLANKDYASFKTSARKWVTTGLGKDLKFANILREAESHMAEVNDMQSSKDLDEYRGRVSGNEYEASLRGLILGVGSIDANDFASEIRKHFFVGKEEDAQEVTGRELNVQAMLAVVKSADKNVEDAQKEEKDIEKLLSELAKFYDGISAKLEDPEATNRKHVTGSSVRNGAGNTATVNYSQEHKGLKEKAGKHSTEVEAGKVDYRVGVKSNGSEVHDHRNAKREAASLSAQATRKASTIASSAFGILIDGIRSRRQEFRSVLAKMVTHDSSKKSESFDFANESASILDRF